MSTEDLMKPRYKVIADYPDSILEVGEIFETYENGVKYVTEQSKVDVREYPHLFKPLQWWEEREVTDFPVYIKHQKSGEVFKIISVDWRFKSGYLEGDNFPRSFVNFLPSTSTEYNEYLKQSKK